MVAGATYLGGFMYLKTPINHAPQKLTTQPPPMEFVDACTRSSYRDLPSIWHNDSNAARTFVKANCTSIVHYIGINQAWTIPWNTPVIALASIGPMFIVVSNDCHAMIALDSENGEPRWGRQCAQQFTLDPSQFDRGTQTPNKQRVEGTCGSSSFSVDPETGN